MTMCLSKSLCCPFGSLVFGSAQDMKKARQIRKSLGGGMRQIGIIGAAGGMLIGKYTPLIYGWRKILNDLLRCKLFILLVKLVISVISISE